MRILLAGLWGWMPALACAHGWGGPDSPTWNGLLHVLMNPALFLPIAGVALLASRGGRPQLETAQLWLPAGVLAGALLAGLAAGWTGVTVVNRMLIVLTGLLVALDVRMPGRAVLVLVLFAGMLGADELQQLEPVIDSPLRFWPGVVLGAMVVQGGIGALTLLKREPWGGVAVRVAGSWIAAIGLIYAAFQYLPRP